MHAIPGDSDAGVTAQSWAFMVGACCAAAGLDSDMPTCSRSHGSEVSGGGDQHAQITLRFWGSALSGIPRAAFLVRRCFTLHTLLSSTGDMDLCRWSLR